jgi:hypothetical protein
MCDFVSPTAPEQLTAVAIKRSDLAKLQGGNKSQDYLGEALPHWPLPFHEGRNIALVRPSEL